MVSKTLLLFVSFVLSFSVVAQCNKEERWINFGGISYHTNRSKDYNEFNYGLGFRHCLYHHVDVAYGWYHNSNNKDSLYFSVPLTVRMGRIGVGFVPGIVLGGYKQPVIPIAPPTASFRLTKEMTLAVVYVPPILSSRDEVWWFRLEFLLSR